MRKIRVLVCCPNPVDSTSFFRGAGPFNRMPKDYEDIEIHNFQDISQYYWGQAIKYDLVFLQRPYTPTHVKIAEITKRLNVPLILDYDDDLLCVPKDNPAHETYSPPDVKKNIEYMCSMADHIFTSTAHLAKQFSPFEKKVTVIRNALDLDRIFTYRKVDHSKSSSSILWRGSPTHQRDIMTFMNQMVAASNKYNKWSWVFVGDAPWWIQEPMGKLMIHVKATDPLEYMTMIHKLSPSLMVVPLHNNKFNMSKSNIALLEGVFAGAVPLCPDWEEWKIPGVLNYANPEDFGNLIEAAMNGEYDLPKLNQIAWEYVQEHYNLKLWNQKRYDIIKMLA